MKTEEKPKFKLTVKGKRKSKERNKVVNATIRGENKAKKGSGE